MNVGRSGRVVWRDGQGELEATAWGKSILVWVVEAVTNSVIASDQIQVNIPGSWINCGGGGLGWSGGGALGVKLAMDM